MATSTISARLDDEEISELDLLCQMSGFDRSTLLKSIFRKGVRSCRFELAAEKYRGEEVTLSKACEIAGMSHWDFLGKMELAGLELHYGPTELKEDLETITGIR